MKLLKIFKNRAQGLVEYGLILALLAIVTITVVSATGEKITGILTPTKNAVGDAATSVKSN